MAVCCIKSCHFHMDQKPSTYLFSYSTVFYEVFMFPATTALTGHLGSVQVHSGIINAQQGDLNDDIDAFKTAIAGVDCQGVASCESLQTTVASLTEVSAVRNNLNGQITVLLINMLLFTYDLVSLVQLL